MVLLEEDVVELCEEFELFEEVLVLFLEPDNLLEEELTAEFPELAKLFEEEEVWLPEDEYLFEEDTPLVEELFYEELEVEVKDDPTGNLFEDEPEAEEDNVFEDEPEAELEFESIIDLFLDFDA